MNYIQEQLLDQSSSSKKKERKKEQEDKKKIKQTLNMHLSSGKKQTNILFI